MLPNINSKKPMDTSSVTDTNSSSSKGKVETEKQTKASTPTPKLQEPTPIEQRKRNYKELLDGNKHEKAAKQIQDDYGLGTKTDHFDVVKKFKKKSTNATTSGGFHPETREGRKDVSVTVSKKAMDNSSYEKQVRRQIHEDTHAHQRSDKSFMKKSSKAEREFYAYTNELKPMDDVPVLSKKEMKGVKRKAEDNYSQIPKKRRKELEPRHDAMNSGDWSGVPKSPYRD